MSASTYNASEFKCVKICIRDAPLWKRPDTNNFKFHAVVESKVTSVHS